MPPIWFILCMILAFAFLFYMTDCLGFRLPKNIEAVESKSKGLIPPLNSNIPSLLDMPCKPSQFIAQDMPATFGNLNIMCKRL